MRSSLVEVRSNVWGKLRAAGFEPMEEFNAVDSLLHPDDMLGVISFEGSSVVADALVYESGNFCVETDHHICLRLYGKSGDFVDYEELSDACYQVFFDIVSDEEMLICKMEMSAAVQSMPLRRLERTIRFTVRYSEKAEVEDV